MKKQNINLKNGGKNICLLGGSSFFNDIGSEMITPILPFLITSLGGAGVAVGLLSGLREGLSSLFNLFGGWFSDRIGKRKELIFLGYFISVVSRFLIGIVGSWQQLVAFVSFERLGKMRDAPRDVIVSVSTKKRGRGFGIHQMMDTSGAIIGTLFVLFLFWKLNLDFKTIIFIAVGISVFSLVPLFFVTDPKIKKTKKNLLKGVKNLNNKLKYFIFVASVFTLANFGVYMFLLLRARDITGNIIYPLGLYVLFNLVFAVFVIPFGNLSDKIGRKKVLFLGYILFFVVSLSFAYIENLTYLVILFMGYGLVYAMTYANHKALVSDLSGNMRGTAIGFYYMCIGLASIIAGIVAGRLWDVNYSTMFIYLSVVAIIATILLIFVKER